MFCSNYASVSKKYNHYLGRAGHLAIMAEFLIRGWNVAIPEVDIGDDIFVVQDDDGTFRRVQVKTSTATVRKGGFSGKFSVSIKNLKNLSNVLVHYVFMARNGEDWLKPLVIRQDQLFAHYKNEGLGSVAGGNITFYFSYAAGRVLCSGKDFTNYVNAFVDFPQLQH